MNRSSIITVDDSRIELAEIPGAEPPIILLHEGLGSVAMWRDFPVQLAKASGHRVVYWSRRSYGASDPLLLARTPNYMHEEAALVKATMNALQIEKAYLLGHSDGGSIALITASAMPERILGLILEAPHVYVEALTVESIAKIKTIYESTDLKLRLGRYHKDPDNAFWRWNDIWLNPEFRDWNIEGLLPSIRSPILMVQGYDDEYGTFDQLDRIEKRLGQTRRLALNQCGHSPHRDQPQLLLAAITAFLEGAGGRVAFHPPGGGKD